MFNIQEIWLRLYKKDTGILTVIVYKVAGNLGKVYNKKLLVIWFKL